MTASQTARSAGSLYNFINGQRQYALVEGDKISIGPYSSAPPEPEGNGRRWLPVEFEDSQPFDPELHYREQMPARVDGDRVVRTFLVRPKRPDEIEWERQFANGRA